MQNKVMEVERVLVVDDYADTIDALCTLFEVLGVSARGTTNGPDAIDAVADFEPSIVFLDLSLPAMDGFETARRLRRVRTAMPYLVAFSGAHRKRESALEAGFDDFLLKPVGALAIRSVLSRAISARRE